MHSPEQTPGSTGLYTPAGVSLDPAILQWSGSGVLVYLVPVDSPLGTVKLLPWSSEFLACSSGYRIEMAVAPEGTEPYSLLLFRGGRLLRSVGDAPNLPLGAVAEFVFDYDNQAVKTMKYFTRPEPEAVPEAQS